VSKSAGRVRIFDPGTDKALDVTVRDVNAASRPDG
jgi:hypothetical protein